MRASNIIFTQNFSYSGNGGYQHWWAPNLRSTIAAGFAHQDLNAQLIGPSQASTATKEQWNAFVNLIWNPVAFMTTGIQYMYGKRIVVANGKGNERRHQPSGASLSKEEAMLELIEGLPGNVVGIAVSGRLTLQDCQDVLVPAMQRSLKRHDKIRLYYELNSRFPGAAWDELDLGLEHASRCERVAIVTDIGWVRLTVKALRFLIPSKIRVFATDQARRGSCLDRRASRISRGYRCPRSRRSAAVPAPANEPVVSRAQGGAACTTLSAEAHLPGGPGRSRGADLRPEQAPVAHSR